MKNHVARPTTSAPFPVANVVAAHNQSESRQNNYCGRGRVHGRGHGRGRGRGRNNYRHYGGNFHILHKNKRYYKFHKMIRRTTFTCPMTFHATFVTNIDSTSRRIILRNFIKPLSKEKIIMWRRT